MKSHLLFALAVGVALLCPALARADAASSPPAANPKAAIRKAIDAGNAAYIAAWERGDAGAYAALFAEDGDSVRDDGSVVHGRTEILARMTRTFAQLLMTKGTITTTDLVVDGDRAYEIGTYAFTFKPSKGPSEDDAGRYLTIWGKQSDGSWKITMDSGLSSQECR